MRQVKGWLRFLFLGTLLAASALSAHAQLPPEFKGQDLGEVDLPGSVSVSNQGVWTVTAGGSDIWGANDTGFFVFREHTGNGSVTMRFVNRTGGHFHGDFDAAKSGPMMRGSLEPDAVSAFLPFQGDRLVDPHFRFEDGGATTNFEIEMRGYAPTPENPLWQRLERQGNRISGLISNDGRIWTSLVSVQMDNMPQTVLAGIGATMHAGEDPLVATYDNVSIGPSLSPQNVVAMGRDRGALVMWSAVPGAEGYNVYIQADDRSTNKITAEPTQNTSIEIQNLENGKATTVVVAAIQGGTEGIGVRTVVTPGAAVLGGLQGVNINTVQPGSHTVDANSVITMRGAGHAIGVAGTYAGQSDGFYFLGMPRSGNATVTVRVVSGPDAERDDPNRQAALMFRESLNEDARFVMMDVTSENGVRLQTRTTISGVTEAIDAEVADPTARPVWLRVVRNGNTFTGFVAEDEAGQEFRQVGDPVTIEGFSELAYVGLGISPRTGFGARPENNLESAEATFDNLTIQ